MAYVFRVVAERFTFKDDILRDEKRRQRGEVCFKKWPSKSAETRHLHGIPAEGKPWTSKRQVRLQGIPPSDRMKDFRENQCQAITSPGAAGGLRRWAPDRIV